MSKGKIFPYLMVLLGAAAAVVSFASRDWKRGAYWALAAALNFVVTL